MRDSAISLCFFCRLSVGRARRRRARELGPRSEADTSTLSAKGAAHPKKKHKRSLGRQTAHHQQHDRRRRGQSSCCNDDHTAGWCKVAHFWRRRVEERAKAGRWRGRALQARGRRQAEMGCGRGGRHTHDRKRGRRISTTCSSHGDATKELVSAWRDMGGEAGVFGAIEHTHIASCMLVQSCQAINKQDICCAASVFFCFFGGRGAAAAVFECGVCSHRCDNLCVSKWRSLCRVIFVWGCCVLGLLRTSRVSR